MANSSGFRNTTSFGYRSGITRFVSDIPALDRAGRALPQPSRAPRRVFKYVDLQDAHYLEEGNLKIGSFKQYANLVGARTDREESFMIYDSGKAVITDFVRGDPQQLALEAAGISIGDAIGCTISDNTVVTSYRDAFCLCFSDRGDIHRPDGKPQAVFQVLNLERLVKRLCELHGLTGFRTGRVRYGSRRANLFEAPSIGPNPFLKPLEYLWEREVRAIFAPNIPEPLPALTASDEGIRLLLRRLPDVA